MSLRDKRLSKLQAQTHRATAATVRRAKKGSVARCGSFVIRQICARVIRAKITPVVMM